MSDNLSDTDFLVTIIKNLVDNPEAVSVDRTTDDKGVLLTLSVHQEDMGKVIGKLGATAQAIRLLVRGKGRRGNAIVSVKINEPVSLAKYT